MPSLVNKSETFHNNPKSLQWMSTQQKLVRELMLIKFIYIYFDSITYSIPLPRIPPGPCCFLGGGTPKNNCPILSKYCYK